MMDLNNLYDVHCHSPKAGVKFIVNYYEGFSTMQGAPYISAGIHPWYPDKTSLQELESTLSKKELIAIGECGLDKVCSTDWELQLDLFKSQIVLADRYGKPLIIHCVRAWSELIASLKGVRVPVVIHGFNKRVELGRSLLEEGYYISIGLAALKPGMEELIKAIPVEKMFCETDDRAESVVEVYKAIAAIKEIDLNSFALQVQKNVLKVFEIE